MKKRLLLFYDHFYPSFKAGGPTQSLVNLVRELHSAYEISIVCKHHEMGEIQPMKGIEVNTWINWESKAKVYYWQYGWNEKNELKTIFSTIDPDVVFINGIYSLYFNLLPLWFAVQHKKKNKHLSIILSARGMLHTGALSQKSFKKKIYLQLFRLLGLHKAVTWHATDANEAAYIRATMGASVLVKEAANFPNLLPVVQGPEKKTGELFLGTIALISPMKNHLEVLKALAVCNNPVTWHIFGPVKDEGYWKLCKEQISQLPQHISINYHGELTPQLLQEAMQQFQVFIMPSKSENFGHALVEALSAGKPVITTTTTPFADLEQNGCGMAIDPAEVQNGLINSIRFFAEMNKTDFEKSSAAAVSYIHDKMNPEQLKKTYDQIFAGA